ncbi:MULTISPECIES: methyltransferase domain-containing protein [Thermomonospora]|uniref:Protein-L-isoaspartate O-methyltransferase n=1 Tax=Thermomonospora curvata (strain ATCC 19995 / DSM 43183 / JCM 3096 / KCTC 9072 / NBRC 15933 / NCIMB 10081 / Henssen B9) TaxID=471852 RepID=D1A5I2_THECD|nr:MULTISPECIES: methyltransferase domain-containing protein [Thermomonospora]ACY96342.1 protein-L-isoaspartate(D-aspartate)O-methyltrans ferase [Thermomonospora curvata DSM 43183]PKK15747.1 MAG: protein-L-isoaspartate(D-aspartate) O-methyltransferase [Thermomonospora sp. CIF 1]
MIDFAERIDRLADLLEATGQLSDPVWRQALHAVPRHLFVPPVAWAQGPDGSGRRIDLAADPDGWWEAAYADQPIITQADDGATDPGTGRGSASSSLSAPGIVTTFLELLDPFDGDRVLEIGTGTGWTAALLASRPGVQVTTIEVDAQIAERAAANLKATGRDVRVLVGDGAEGDPDGAPFDCVHVTCGVVTVPHAWVRQTRPGGVIVFPWMPWYEGGHQVRLTVGRDGTAIGRFHGGCAYMRLRSQRPPDDGGPQSEIQEGTAQVDPRRIFHASAGLDIAIAGLLPDLGASRVTTAEGDFKAWLWTTDCGAQITRERSGETTVLQYGPRALWSEVEDIFFRWLEWGRPGRDRFGITVTPKGQAIWLDAPDNTLRPAAEAT